MPKFLTGFIPGVVAAVVIFSLRDTSPGESQVRQADADEVSEAASAESDLSEAGSAESAVGNSESEEDPGSGNSASIPDRSTSAAESAGASQADTPTARTGSAMPPGAANDVYSPEIAVMLENSVPKKLQERFESEPKEDSWAAYMDGQLRAYFARRPAFWQFNISLIDCRTSICEIHALGFGPDALAVWNTAVADITHQPWHDFNRMSASTRDVQPDVVGIVLILARNTE